MATLIVLISSSVVPSTWSSRQVAAQGQALTVSPFVGFTAGGTVVDITGTGFTGATGVTFGDVEVRAPYFRVNSDGLVTAMSPPHAAGTVAVTVTSSQSAQASAADAFQYSDEGWTVVPSMGTPRERHTATLLDGPECHPALPIVSPPPPAYCGRVLVAGGRSAGTGLNTGEIFDPKGGNGAGSWSTIPGHMSAARQDHAVAALPGGRVLVMGGRDNGGQVLKSVDMYVPNGDGGPGSWTTATSMAFARSGSTATALDDGRILVVGGYDDSPGRNSVDYVLKSTEIFNSTGNSGAGSWTRGPDVPPDGTSHGRAFHSAVATTGKVLIAGGLSFNVDHGLHVAASADVFQPLPAPATGAWTAAGSPSPVGSALAVLDGPTCRRISAPVPTYCGKAIMPGGARASSDPNAGLTDQTSLFDGVNGWTTLSQPMSMPRMGFTATTLPTGQVLATGGNDERYNPTPADQQIYDPATNGWRHTYRPSIASGRTFHSATELANGGVLVTGGTDGNNDLASAELFLLTTPPPTRSPVILATTPPYGPMTGSTVTMTGSDLFPAISVSFDGFAGRIVSNTDTSVTVIAPPHAEAADVKVTLTVEPDRTAVGYFSYYQGKWTPTRFAPGTSRVRQNAVLLAPPGCYDGTLRAPTYPCGQVLVAGGDGHGGAELYDPDHDSWSMASSMNFERASPGFQGVLFIGRNIFSLTLLRDGKVLAVGGCCRGDGQPLRSSYELYDPTVADGSVGRGTWTAHDVMLDNAGAGLVGMSATLMADGRVLVAGNRNSLDDRTAEIYDPKAQVGSEWTAAPLMGADRAFHTASLLAGGQILLSGGFGHPVPAPSCTDGGPGHGCDHPLSTTEMFEPSGGVERGSWAFGADLKFTHYFHTATTLNRADCDGGRADLGYPCGQVLVAGGNATVAELYDPAGKPSPDWHPTGAMREARNNHTATLLPDGRVLAIGGVASLTAPAVATAEIYDPTYLRWTHTADLPMASGYDHTATLLDGTATMLDGPLCRAPSPPSYCGQVLAVGRRSEDAGGAASELYTPVPAVSRLEPSSGSSRGGVPVVIHGFGFTRDTGVSFGGVPAPSFTVDSSTQITAITPPQSSATNTVDVVLSNSGGTSTGIYANAAARYTYNNCVPSPRAGELSYPAGYSLVGLPGGTTVPAQSFLYGWFNLGGGNSYTAGDPTKTATVAGHGYWAWFSCTRVVPPGPGQPSVTSPLSAYHASIIGNPSGTASATVSGHDFAARWDQSLNGGAGGYTISGYREQQRLAVGEGAWVFAYADTMIATRAVPP